MEWLKSLQMHEILVYSLAIGLPVVVIVSQAIVSIVKALIKHRERMAMIERGLHPDLPPEQLPIAQHPATADGLDQTQPYRPE